MLAPVTSLFTGLFALLLIRLTLRVIKHRRSGKVALGDGDDPLLRRARVAHGNFTQYAPFILILLGLGELQGLPMAALIVFGTLTLTGRVLHAHGISQDPEPMKFRVVGMHMTITPIIIFSTGLVGWTIYHVVSG